MSHSHRKTKRRFEANLQRKRYWVPSLQRHITLTVSAKGIKTISRIGIEAALAKARSRGLIHLAAPSHSQTPAIQARLSAAQES